MPKVTFKILHRSKQEFTTVYMRCTHRYKEFSRSVGQVPLRSWDKKRKWVNGTDPVSIKTRNLMFEYKDYLENLSEDLSIDDISSLFDMYIGEKKEAKVLPNERLTTLCDYFDEFVKIHRKKYTYNVIRKYNTAKRNIQLFCDRYCYKDDIHKMTVDDQKIFFSKFIDFLCYDEVYEGEKRIKKRYFNETVLGDLKKVTTVCNYFEKAKLKVDLSKMSKYLKTTENPRPYFSVDEIMKMYRYQTESGFEEAARDTLVFQGFAGLRHNELFNVTKDNIATLMVGSETFKVLSHVPNKTKSRNNVPLNNICIEIIEKWSKRKLDAPKKYDKKNKRWEYFDDCLLPVKCNQQTNKFLHDMCKKLGFDDIHPEVKYSGNDRFEFARPKYKCVGTHTMRHSFGYYLKEKGCSDGEVADLMGIAEATFRNNYRHVLGKESTYRTFKSLNVEVLCDAKKKVGG